MLKNYLAVALRNLRKHPGYTFVNVFGLAVGLACCLFILLYVRDELSFDRYHDRAGRIYRAVTTESARTPPALAPALVDSYPHVVDRAVRFWPLFAPAKMYRDDVVFVETDVAFADPAVFDMFTWPLQAGTPGDALSAPNTIVLSQSTAAKYFGDEDPLGATLTFWGQAMEVTGVMDDVPLRSHYRVDFLVSFATLYGIMGDDLDENWAFPGFLTYVRLQDGVAPDRLEAAARTLLADHLGEEAPTAVMQPLTSIYLHSDLPGDVAQSGNVGYVYLLSTVALLVLALACINFINLTTARSARRAREVGVRKVLGAGRRQLVGQFLGESVLLSLVALLGALLLVEAGLPAFNRIAGKAIAVHYVADPTLIIALFALVSAVGLVAGGFPAVYLSRFQPVHVLKGGGTTRAGGRAFRKGLVVFQFAASTVLAIGAFVVTLQLGYMQEKDLGYDEAHVLVLDGDRYPLLKEALQEVPGVARVAGVPQVIGAPLSSSRYRAAGVPVDSTRAMLQLPATFDFIETMGLELVAGRSLSEAHATDAEAGYVLNEAAVRALGWAQPEEAVGKAFAMPVAPEDGEGEAWREGHIVGVVRDFHYASLHHTIEPLALYVSRDLNLTLVRLRNAAPSTLAQVEAIWEQVNPDAPFNYYFLDAHLQQAYAAERRLGELFGIFTALALLVAGLGLLGLAAFTAEQRTKEIGVRKVFGATVLSIVGRLSTDFVRLALIAVCIAVPVAYVGVHRWLEHFAYRVEIGPGVFLLAGGLVVAVVLLASGYQAVKAARTDPVKSLRYE